MKKICLTCGKEYIANTSKRKYCTRKCSIERNFFRPGEKKCLYPKQYKRCEDAGPDMTCNFDGNCIVIPVDTKKYWGEIE